MEVKTLKEYQVIQNEINKFLNFFIQCVIYNYVQLIN